MTRTSWPTPAPSSNAAPPPAPNGRHRFEAWQTANPEGAALLERIEAKKLPVELDAALPVFEAGKDVSTRAASGKVLNAIGPVLPELWGGSADLAESNNTTIEGSPSFIPASRSTDAWKGNPYGRVLHFGIREHAAASIVNGISLHGRTRAFSGTFLIFSDYQRPAIRLGALMGVPSLYVWTHDSIGLGEDGPTHQPVEQLATLRAIPGLDVVRPGDANEVAAAWKTMLENHENPAGIVLTRQNIPTYARGEGDAEGDTFGSAAGVAKGGYVLAEASKDGATVPAQVILIGTGSEVQLAVKAREALQAEGIATRVVSMPCVEWFNKQDAAYRESVLPAAVKARVSVEAGLALGWQRIRRRRRPLHQPRALRRLGRLQAPLPGVRHHRRSSRRRRQGLPRQPQQLIHQRFRGTPSHRNALTSRRLMT